MNFFHNLIESKYTGNNHSDRGKFKCEGKVGWHGNWMLLFQESQSALSSAVPPGTCDFQHMEWGGAPQTKSHKIGVHPSRLNFVRTTWQRHLREGSSHKKGKQSPLSCFLPVLTPGRCLPGRHPGCSPYFRGRNPMLFCTPRPWK